jgi:hypothetical protein
LLFSLDGLGWIPRDRGVTIADFEVTLSQLELHFVRESTLRPPWIDYLNREVQRFCSDGARESVISMRWSDRKWFRFLFAFLSSTKRTWSFKLMETHDAAWTPLSLQVCSGVDNNFEFTWLPDWFWIKEELSSGLEVFPSSPPETGNSDCSQQLRPARIFMVFLFKISVERHASLSDAGNPMSVTNNISMGAELEISKSCVACNL